MGRHSLEGCLISTFLHRNWAEFKERKGGGRLKLHWCTSEGREEDHAIDSISGTAFSVQHFETDDNMETRHCIGHKEIVSFQAARNSFMYARNSIFRRKSDFGNSSVEVSLSPSDNSNKSLSGTESGCPCSCSLHDYHCSGSWWLLNTVLETTNLHSLISLPYPVLPYRSSSGHSLSVPSLH